MHISELEMYDILKERMSEKEAREFINYIAYKVEDKFVEAQQVFATKEDLLKLELKITKLVSEYKLETSKLISDAHSETLKLISDSRSETLKLISDSKAETSKLISDSRSETLKLISDSKAETLKLVSETKIEMVKLITDSKAETIKWMLVFITTSSVAIIGTILTVMKIISW
jgi:vacuolar-type H+-ATPase subunit H